MIEYDSKKLTFLWRLEGSVMPKAFAFTIPSVALTVLLHYGLHNDPFREHIVFLDEVSQSAVWSASVIALGTLLAVRTNKAYGRFWEGITLVQLMRAEWFEAASNLMAFSAVACKRDAQMTDRVCEFQSILVRLMSLMHGSALRQIGGNNEEFDVLDLQSIDVDSLNYLAGCDDRDVNRVEVLLHWIQVLVTDGAATGVIEVAAPILTRAYQTLSRGMVNLHNARKLADVPYPFPLSQMTIGLLIVHSLITPLIVATFAKHVGVCICVTFVPIFGMWGMTFVAGELEQPFGSDPNDLPLSVLQYEFNTTLLMLLDTEVSRAPHLDPQTAMTADDLKNCVGSRDPHFFAKSRTNSVGFLDSVTEGKEVKKRLSQCSQQCSQLQLTRSKTGSAVSLNTSPSLSRSKTGSAVSLISSNSPRSHNEHLEWRVKQNQCPSLSAREKERKHYLSAASHSFLSSAASSSNRLSIGGRSDCTEDVIVPCKNSRSPERLVETVVFQRPQSDQVSVREPDAELGKVHARKPSDAQRAILLERSTSALHSPNSFQRNLSPIPENEDPIPERTRDTPLEIKDARGVGQKRRDFHTNPRTPRLSSPMATPREEDFNGSSGL